MSGTHASAYSGGASAAFRSWLPFLIVLGAAIVLQVWVRPLLGTFNAKIALDIGINVIVAVSLTLVNGFTGQFSIGHAGFMAVGAYIAAAIVYYGSLSAHGVVDVDPQAGLLSSMMDERVQTAWATWGDARFAVSLMAGGLVSAAFGYVVGLPSLRLKGDYLAIVTLGFGEILRVAIQQTPDVLLSKEEIAVVAAPMLLLHVGGPLGFFGLPPYSSLFWVWLIAGVTLVFAVRVKSSTAGRAFLSIRENEVAAEAMGVDTTRYKVRAFVVSAFFAGVAGGLFAHTGGVQLNPGELGFQKSFDIIIMVVLGGLGSVSGAAIAAAILTVLPEALREPPHVWPYALAIGAAATVFSARRGWRVVARRLGVLVLVASALETVRWWAIRSGVELSEYRMVLYALALIVMMIARPQGLLGVRELWDKALWRGVFARRSEGAR